MKQWQWELEQSMANTFVTVPDAYCLSEPIQYYGESRYHMEVISKHWHDRQGNDAPLPSPVFDAPYVGYWLN